MENPETQNEYLTRRIGGTVYKVKIAFSDTEQETMEEKVLLVKLEAAELLL